MRAISRPQSCACSTQIWSITVTSWSCHFRAILVVDVLHWYRHAVFGYICPISSQNLAISPPQP